MAKDQSTTISESIFKAFKRRISPARPVSTNWADAKPSTAVASASNTVLIEYNHSPGRANPKRHVPVNNQGTKGLKFQGGYNNNNTTGASNEKFSDFIDDVKNKIKANSSFIADNNVARRATTRRDSFNDRVSHFINRAKLKIRSTTIVSGDHGDGKLQAYTPR